MIGTVTLPVKIQGADMPMKAYVLHSKGPPLIMGFTFLEDNQWVVDCTARTLTMHGGAKQVKCLPVQAASAQCDLAIPTQKGGILCQPVHEQLDSVVVQRFPVDGHLPPLPKKHFSTDAAYDFLRLVKSIFALGNVPLSILPWPAIFPGVLGAFLKSAPGWHTGTASNIWVG